MGMLAFDSSEIRSSLAQCGTVTGSETRGQCIHIRLHAHFIRPNQLAPSLILPRFLGLIADTILFFAGRLAGAGFELEDESQSITLGFRSYPLLPVI